MNRNALRLRRYLRVLMGTEGYAHVVHGLQNLMEWVLRVTVLELGAWATGWTLRLRAPSEMSGLSAISIHQGIACIGMIGFLVSELLYEVRAIAGQLAGIRAAWRKSGDREQPRAHRRM